MTKLRCTQCGGSMMRQRREVPVRVVNHHVIMNDGQPRQYDAVSKMWLYVCTRCRVADDPDGQLINGRFVKVVGAPKTPA